MKLSLARTFDRWYKKTTKNSALVWMAILWLLAVCWLAFFCNLGKNGLLDETEPLFVEAARQMTVTGDWITPYFNGETRFDKPPLIYWLMAIAFQTFGVNEWAARLPSALAGLCLTFFCFYGIKRFGFTDDPAPAPRLGNSLATRQERRDMSRLYALATLLKPKSAYFLSDRGYRQDRYERSPKPYQVGCQLLARSQLLLFGLGQ